MKIKLIAVMVAVSALFIGAVLWRTDSFVYGDRLSWVEAQAQTQLDSINYSLNTELKSLQRVIATFNGENFQKGKINWSSLNPYYAAASFSIRDSQLDPQTLLVKENSKATNWNKDFIKTALSPLVNYTKDVKFYVKPFQDSQKGRYVALVFLEGQRGYALFGSGEIFQSLIDAQRGALSSFSIVTNTGLTVGHSVPEYLGTVMRDDPVFDEAQKTGSSHGAKIFKSKVQDFYGSYERIPQSNLLILSSAMLKETMKGRSGLWWQFLLLGCGLVAVGVAALLAVVMPAEKNLEKLQNQLFEAKAKTLPAMMPEKVTVQDPETVHKEKLETSMRVASALSHEIGGPLTSILGYSQMILAKTPETEIVESADSIIRETRAVRGILDKLLIYAGEENKAKNSMKIEGPLIKALKGLEPTFTTKGVKIVKNIQDTAAMDIQVDAIIKALTNILHNSVEAMERMANKEITVELFEDSAGIHLSIADSGEGISAKNLEKIFDPFFTTRSFQNHMGLGLSVAFGILKEHNAEVTVESQQGKGTKIAVIFKKQATATVLKAPIEIVEEKEEVVIPVELPQLKEESIHREEAEVKYAEVQAALPKQSPLDINIENLLELPEAGDGRRSFASTTVKAEVKAETSNMDDELNFIDGFLSDNAEEPKKSKTKNEVVADGPTAEELTMMEAGPIKVNYIVPPQEPAKPKASKLDSYQVDIRRPEKRI